MKRTRTNKTPSAIFCSDFHLREDTPLCFTGDFQKEQWTAVEFIKDLQAQYNCLVLHAGDLFDHWKPSPWLLSRAIELLPKQFYTIYGQHDLPQHNLDLDYKSGVNTLRQAEIVKVLSGCHWGQEPQNDLLYELLGISIQKILVWHHLTYQQKPFPEASGGNARAILRKYPQFDIILTGDNHTSFTVEYQGRRLVNPGNLTRQTASQINYQPRVALWYSEDNSITWINIPIQKGVISREHIEIKEQRNKRIDAFINRLDSKYKTELSFEDNLTSFFEVNQTRKDVKSIIYKSIE